MLKIEIGAGASPQPGYIQCEIRPLPHVDHVCNAWDLPFGTNTVDEVYSYHMLEHVTEAQGRASLAEWYRVLKSGGRLEVHVPDLEGHLRQYWGNGFHDDISLSDREYAMLGIYGWQQFPEDCHKWGYTFETLSQRLVRLGFVRLARLSNPRPHPELLVDVEAYKP